MLQPLVSVAWLARQIDDPELRVVDTRWYLADPDQGRREYQSDHIPGALFFDLETDLSAPTGPGRHPLPDPDVFADLLGSRGIGTDHHVVAYDASGGAVAARLWWLLRHLGHHRVSVLDGGYEHWRGSGYPVTAAVTRRRPEVFTPTIRPDDTIDRTELFERLGNVALIDARAPERYRGDLEPVDPVAGHIPTALSAPYTNNLTGDGSFKSPEELARQFRALGLDPDERVVSSCGSGVTACHNVLALHLAGFAQPILYPGSWSDWCANALPVATGPNP